MYHYGQITCVMLQHPHQNWEVIISECFYKFQHIQIKMFLLKVKEIKEKLSILIEISLETKLVYCHKKTFISLYGRTNLALELIQGYFNYYNHLRSIHFTTNILIFLLKSLLHLILKVKNKFISMVLLLISS